MHRVQTQLVLFIAAVLAVVPAFTAAAKLGEDLPALTKRFGSKYKAIGSGDGAKEFYLFNASNLRVYVTLVNGRSALEYYYSDHPLLAGRPPEVIWRAVRAKNAPGEKWQSDGKGGFVSADNRYSTWFETGWTEFDPASASPKITHAIGICDRYGMSGDAKFAGTMSAAAAATDKPAAAATVSGIAYNPQHNGYSVQYFQAAEAEGKHVYAAKTIPASECMVYDYPGHFLTLEEGEPLRVLSVDPETYRLLVTRLRFNTLAHVRQTSVTIR